jgi:hypothetical protein
MNYSYIQIAEILERILTLYHESFAEKVLHYLRDYLTTLRRELLMNDDLNDLAVRVYQSHRAAFEFIFENRPDPASQLYPFFEKAIVDAGFVMGSRNKGYARFSSKKLFDSLPRSGRGWPDHEQFLIEVDYYWSKKSVVVKAVIAPGDDALRERILNAVSDLPLYSKPKGKQWMSFYIKKFTFVAEEVASEEETEIKKKIGKIVSDLKADADEILKALEGALN